MNYTYTVEDNILNIKINGDLLGLSNEDELLELALNQIKEGNKYTIIDISGIGYMNSTGLNLLIKLLTKFRNDDGEVILLTPSEQVKKLLVITKLSAIFTIEETLEEAKEAIFVTKKS